MCVLFARNFFSEPLLVVGQIPVSKMLAFRFGVVNN
jgi:hypothetical protein